MITLPLQPYLPNIMEHYDQCPDSWAYTFPDFKYWLKLNWRAECDNDNHSQFFIFENQQDALLFALRWA